MALVEIYPNNMSGRRYSDDHFKRHSDDEAMYEDAEYYVNSGCCAWEKTGAVTLSKRDINEYLNEE